MVGFSVCSTGKSNKEKYNFRVHRWKENDRPYYIKESHTKSCTSIKERERKKAWTGNLLTNKDIKNAYH